MFEGKEVIKIFGPPGTGKTTKILSIVEKLLDSGVSPDNIAVVSFTKKAVNEFVDRSVNKFTKFKREDFRWFKTIHALAYEFQGNKQLITDKQKFDFAESLGLEVSRFSSIEDGMGSKIGDKIINMESLSRLRLVSLEQQFDEENNFDFGFYTLQNWQKQYKQFKEREKLVDFTDMLEGYSKQVDVDYFLIDEAQDLCPLQWKVVEKASQSSPHIFIAGDDDQSIYKWAGASAKEFLGIEGEEIVLDKSYRLPICVFDKSKEILKEIKERKKKEFSPVEKDGNVQYINGIEDFEFKKDEEYLILFRNRWQAKEIREILKERGIPFSDSNNSSINQELLKAIVAWEGLRKGANPLRNIISLFKKMSFKIKYEEDLVNPVLLKQEWYKIFNKVKLEELDYIRNCKKNGYSLKAEPKIKISTIHQAKGGESDNVILFTDVSHKVWENIDNDEEHRVWYVAVTRSKKNLFIVHEKSNKFYKL
jgi:DNA helicase-2/ATP-dependent DNA helicase PcrA